MEEIIKDLRTRLATLKLLASQRGFSSKKREAKNLIPEYEKTISILERALAEHSNENGALPIPDVSNRRELYFAFMKEYNSLMGTEYEILKEEVEVLLAKYSC